MSLTRPVFAACLALLLSGPAMAMDMSHPPQGSGFTLQEPAARLRLRLVPGTTLAAGYHSPFYQQDPATGAITLRTDGLQPAIRGHVAPATVLREGSAWYYQQTPADMTATVHIDIYPKDGRVIIGRIQSTHGAVAELVADRAHSQVTATVHDGTSTSHVVVGTLYPDRSVSYQISSRPNGTLTITVNGTRSILAMPAAATAPVMWFEAVAGETGWHMPCHDDQARVTFTALAMTHPAA